MDNMRDVFGSKVFNDSVMRERLPKVTYNKIKETLEKGDPLDPDVAEVVASAMKDWAIELGATHFTHWFQPMTGITAEKHDSFINPTSDGRVVMEFSGKELIKGEPDASSFPSGGLRDTYEARGYTVWDCTSPAFVKDDALCIPTAFMSYKGVALDKKTPLLRSMEAISKQAMRILKVFNNKTAKKVVTTVGPEQEYFIIDRALFEKRKDLMLTGRTLFGAPPPKGQELEDHYFGCIKDRISKYMQELDTELWKLGISAKTRHNEVAPAQHELAPIFNTANIATDHNQLVMEIMKKVAIRHGLACLLHEKPFAGINGSGKHNNWSISTDDGINLLEPGSTPHENAQFLVFLCAIIKAVDTYAPILRLSAANPGNDHRLGANEAPPAIVSIFLGDQLTDVLESISNDREVSCRCGECIEIGVTTLPSLPKDSTDRNRTSPFAFTGNKFEFRMVPSSASIAGPNFTLNTIVAEALDEFARKLECSENINKSVKDIVKETYKMHSKVIFNGNNYSEKWVVEAKRRGLPNISSMVEACCAIIDPKTVACFEKHAVLTKEELHSRYEIFLETYSKTVNIEALTMTDMSRKQILPAAFEYISRLAKAVCNVRSASPDADISALSESLKTLSDTAALFKNRLGELEEAVKKASYTEGAYEHAKAYRDLVFPEMAKTRETADKLEMLVAEELWPFPTYIDLLFRV
jgi:glutamine synthetase